MLYYEDVLANPKACLVALHRFCELDSVPDALLDELASSVNASRDHVWLRDPDLTRFYATVKQTKRMVHNGYDAVVSET